MKKSILILASLTVLVIFGSVFFFKGLIISNPSEAESQVKEIVVYKISEGGVKDIVFTEKNGNFFYINRGLEQGYTLEQMEKEVLNKKVTLHLAKTIMGMSNHISQLSVDGKVLYTEFN